MRIFIAGILAIILITGGCHRSPKEARQRLVGRYNLARVGSDACPDVQSSMLVLRRDGTYDQHVTFTNGKTVEELNQRWLFDGGVHLSNFRITATGDLNQYAPETEASLIVEFRNPVVVELNPHGDCFYTQPK
jgi:hypothetical protein